MNESIVAGWYVSILVYAYVLLRALVCSLELVTAQKGFGRTVIAWIVVGIGGVFLSFLHEWYLAVPENLDYVLVSIYGIAIAMIVVTGILIIVAVFRGGETVPPQRVLLVICPALAWSLLWLAIMRIHPSIELPFFHKKLLLTISFDIACAISLVYFLREYIGNMRNVEAKVAEIVSFFGGKRTGQSLTEGISHLPGVMPLMFEVTLFALFRFSIFWGVVRRVVLIPLSFSGTIVAHARDGKAVVFTVAAMYKIVNVARYDDLIEDGTDDPRQSMRTLLVEHFNRIAKHYVGQHPWEVVARGSGHGKKLFSDVNRELKELLGLALVGQPQLHWIGFENQNLQNIFQELSSRDFRESAHHMKGVEIDRIFRALRSIDPAATHSDAERLWEAFNNGGRGSFVFST